MTARALPLALLALLLGFAPAACAPKAGDRCEVSGEMSCPTKDKLLVCISGTLAQTPCPGPAGCTKGVTATVCDRGWETAGTPCTPAEEKAKDCSADGKRELTCTGGKLASRTCPGEGGCSQKNGTDVDCAGGDPPEGSACVAGISPDRCAADGGDFLYCAGRTLKRIACGGTNKCRDSTMGPTCDETVGTVGAACHFANVNLRACSADKTRRLGCTDDKWTEDAACAAGTACAFTQMDVSCGRTGCWIGAKDAACK